jgi:hypothetical protein
MLMPSPKGNMYEVWVITVDGFYVAGGSCLYTRQEDANSHADSWLLASPRYCDRQGLRAFVVQY